MKNNPARQAELKKVGDWMTQGALVLALRKKSSAVNVVCMQDGGGVWTAIAVVTPAKTAANAQAVLDQHGHHLVGSYGDMATCIQEVENWARTWEPKAPDCPCDDVDDVAIPARVAGRFKAMNQIFDKYTKPLTPRAKAPAPRAPRRAPASRSRRRSPPAPVASPG